MSKDDDERLWNLIVFKVYATDKEMEEIFPVLAGIGLIALIGCILIYIFR